MKIIFEMNLVQDGVDFKNEIETMRKAQHLIFQFWRAWLCKNLSSKIHLYANFIEEASLNQVILLTSRHREETQNFRMHIPMYSKEIHILPQWQ